MRAEVRRRRGVNRRVGAGMVALALGCASIAVGAASLLEAPASASSAPGRPFAPVLERLVLGDLVVAANTNVIAAGGRGARPVDIDNERELSCVLAQPAPVCEDNSSSAPLDVPPGARVVEARLYVETSMPIESNPMEVLLDGPAEGFDYLELTDATAGVPKLYEARGTGEHGSLLQAVWDVTEYVGTGGAGSYTLADIPNERTAPWQPFASWAIVAVYELDPAADLAAMTPAQRARFAPRSISWSDGFAVAADGPVSVPLDGLVVPDVTPFAKSVHVVASSRQGAVDNLLYDGQPVGNNHHAPGAPPVPGVVIGNDPTCNTVTDVFNDTICVLGAPPADKHPGLVNSGSDGTARTSGAAVDIDVVRVPGHYVRPNQSTARLTVRTTGDQSAAVGVLALSVDVPPAHSLALTVAGGQRPSAAEVAALEAESAPPTTAAATTTTAPPTSSTTTTLGAAEPQVERRFASALVPEPTPPATGDTTVTGTTTTTTTVPSDTTAVTAPPLTESPPTDPPATVAPTEPPVTEPPPATDPPATDPPVTTAPAAPTTVVAVPTTSPTPTTVAPTPPGGAPTTTVATAVDPGTAVTTTTVVSSTIPDPDGDPITDPVEEPAETPSGRVVVAAGAIDPGVQRTISFPVAGPVIYGNDWGACRDGCARAHKGIDIIGDRLQPILAMADGVVDHLIDHRTAGYGVAIRDPEGWQYHVYHVNNDRPGTDDGADDGTWRFAPGIADGAPVRAGQVIAWMGDSGNSEYSVPHAHVEIHRPDGTAVNPYWSLRLAQRRATCAAELGAAAAEENAAASAGGADADGAAAAATDADADGAQTPDDEAAAPTTTTTAPTTTTTTVPATSDEPDPSATPTAEEIEREREEAEAWLSREWKDPAHVPDGWLPLELTGGRPLTDNLAARMWLRSSDFIPVDAPALIVGDPRYEADVNCDDPEADIAPAIPAELGAILATIRQMESGGDYSAQARTSSASGAYQFVDGTWGNFGGYARAVQAPPAVQDAAAVRLATSILNSTGGDVSAVPVVWYIGHVPVGAEWDTVPAAPGNVLTPREYQTRWLGVYAQMSGAAEAALLSGSLLTLPPVEPVCRTAILDLPAEAESDSATPDEASDDEMSEAEVGAAGVLAGQSDFLLTLTSGFVADGYGRAVLPETDPCDPARQPITAPAPLPVVPAVGPY